MHTPIYEARIRQITRKLLECSKVIEKIEKHNTRSAKKSFCFLESEFNVNKFTRFFQAKSQIRTGLDEHP